MNKFLQAEKLVRIPLQGQTRTTHRILVVDNDDDIRRLNTQVLIHSGYEVNDAEDGAAGWDALNASGYDLLITDHDMPKKSGVELLKKIYDARMALPTIMATGTWPTEEFTQYPWLKPAVMLLKPYTIAEFLGAVRKLLSSTAGVHEQIAL